MITLAALPLYCIYAFFQLSFFYSMTMSYIPFYPNLTESAKWNFYCFVNMGAVAISY